MLAELRDILGDSATVRLVQAFGGREIRVPMRQQGRTWNALVEAIGHEAAARFCDYFQGERLYLPTDRRMKTAIVRQRAAEMRSRGKSWGEIARALNYSERGARKLLEKRFSAVCHTLPLFADETPELSPND